MPERSDKERIASLETSMDAMKKSEDEAASYRRDVIGMLKEISINQAVFVKFQERAEAEKTACDNRLQALEEHNRIMAAVKQSERRNTQIIAGVTAGFISFVGWAVTLAVEWIKKS